MIVYLGIALAIVLVAFVVSLLLRRKIREKYAVLWILLGLGVIVLGLFPGLLADLTNALGVQLPSNLLFAVAIVLLLGVTLHLSWELSHAEDEIRRVAEDTAILRADLATLTERVTSLERSASSGARSPAADSPTEGDGDQP